MAMICPQCQQIFENQLACSSCQCRLDYYLHSGDEDSQGQEEGDNWQETPFGRILVGVLLVQGLGFGFQQLICGAFLWYGQEVNHQLWSSEAGFFLLHALQAGCLLFSCALAGAGQVSAGQLGALIGLINGFIFLVLHPDGQAILGEYGYFAQPIGHMVLGTIGGRFGSWIWQPPPLLQFGATKVEIPGFSWKLLSPLQFFQGPIHFFRVSIGTVLVVVGVLSSKKILLALVDFSNGGIKITGHWENNLALLEISAAVTLLGAAFAGATTFNGLKQGLCVGIASGIILIGCRLTDPNATVDSLLSQAGLTLILSLMGGWFGGQLLPPVLSVRRQRIVDL